MKRFFEFVIRFVIQCLAKLFRPVVLEALRGPPEEFGTLRIHIDSRPSAASRFTQEQIAEIRSKIFGIT